MMRLLSLLIVLPGVTPHVQAAPAIEVRAPRVDTFGDPLPRGAVARLGTIRWKGSERMRAVAFSPDGKLFAAACIEGCIRIWDYPSGIVLRKFQVENGEQIASMVFTPDQKQIILSVDNASQARVLDLGTGRIDTLGRPIAPLNGGITILSQQGRWVLCCESAEDTRHHRLKLIDLTHPTGAKVIGTLQTQNPSYISADVSQDGRWVAVCLTENNGNEMTGRIYFLDTSTGRWWPTAPFPYTAPVHLLFAPYGKSLFVATGVSLSRWDLKPPARNDEAAGFRVGCTYAGRMGPSSNDLQCIALSRDGKYLAAGNSTGQVLLWETATGKLVRFWQMSVSNTISGLAISVDSKVLAVTTDQDVSVRFYDIASGQKCFPRTGHRGAILQLAFHPSGKALASSSEDCSIRTWDLSPKRTAIYNPAGATIFEERIRSREHATIELHGRGFEEVAFADQGRLLFAGAVDAQICVWQTTKRQSPRRVTEEASARRALAVSADGKLLAIALPESGLQLYDARSGELLKMQPSIGEAIDAVRFSLDAKIISAATATGRLYSREVATGQACKAVPSRNRGVSERYFASLIETEQMLMIWDVVTGRLIRQLENVGKPFSLSGDGRYLASTHEGEVNIALREAATGKIVVKWKYSESPRAIRFSPDGSLLAAGYADGTILLWDARPPRNKVPNDQPLDKLWADLAVVEPAKAFAAIGRLSTMPADAVRLLKDRVKPDAPVDQRVLTCLISDLNHPRYGVREKATRTLERLAPRIENQLESALAEASAETECRLERALRSVHHAVPDGDRLRALRAVEILERIGTAEARGVLSKLAKGEGFIARDARDAVQRLKTP